MEVGWVVALASICCQWESMAALLEEAGGEQIVRTSASLVALVMAVELETVVVTVVVEGVTVEVSLEVALGAVRVGMLEEETEVVAWREVEAMVEDMGEEMVVVMGWLEDLGEETVVVTVAVMARVFSVAMGEETVEVVTVVVKGEETVEVATVVVKGAVSVKGAVEMVVDSVVVAMEAVMD